MKYRKKPVEIEAILLENTPQSIYKAEMFLFGKVDNNSCRAAEDAWERYLDIAKRDGGLKIVTMEGVMLCSFGDYIIKGVKGECYPCKPDIFEMTYELITP